MTPKFSVDDTIICVKSCGNEFTSPRTIINIIDLDGTLTYLFANDGYLPPTELQYMYVEVADEHCEVVDVKTTS